MRVLAIFSVLFSMLSLSVSAEEGKAFDVGLGVGEKIPAQFSVVDQEGKSRDFASLSGEKGVALFFVRSVDWCPFCQRQVLEVDVFAKYIEQLGYNVVTLSYDSVEKLNKFDRKRNVEVTMVSDEKSAMIDAFGLRNEEYGPDHYAHGVPHPAIYIIGKNGEIRAKLLEEGYRVRPKPEDVIAEIKKLDGQG